MKLAFALLLLVPCTFAQVPRPCMSPTQWEGRYSEVDKEKKFQVYGKINYDETASRVRYVAEVDEAKEKDYYDDLYLYNENKHYRLNLKTKKCNVTTPQGTFRPIGIPPVADYVSEVDIGFAGVPNESLTIITFELNTTSSRSYGSVTSPSCIPVMDGYYSKSTGYVQLDFYDITPGIADPSVFIPPSECL